MENQAVFAEFQREKDLTTLLCSCFVCLWNRSLFSIILGFWASWVSCLDASYKGSLGYLRRRQWGLRWLVQAGKSGVMSTPLFQV